MRQLQQFFYELKEEDKASDWNNLGRYWGTTNQKSIGLWNINMFTAGSTEHTFVLDVSDFKPNKTRDDVVSSLEQWAFMLLKPTVTKKHMNSDSRTRSRRAYLNKFKSQSKSMFKISNTDYKNTLPDKTTSLAESPLKITHVLDTTPKKHISKPMSELLCSICNCLKTNLALTNKTNSSKRRLSADDNNSIQKTVEGVSIFIALVNKTEKTSFGTLDETYNHLNKKTCTTTAQLEGKDDQPSQSEESSKLDSEEDPPHKSEEISHSSDNSSSL
jgi:hypothetical protein